MKQTKIPMDPLGSRGETEKTAPANVQNIKKVKYFLIEQLKNRKSLGTAVQGLLFSDSNLFDHLGKERLQQTTQRK